MLTAVLALIALIVWLACRNLEALHKATNNHLAQIGKELGSLHETIATLWACPTCRGSGQAFVISEGFAGQGVCGDCNGTGLKDGGKREKQTC